MFTNHVSGKRLIAKIYKELLELKNKKTAQLKMGCLNLTPNSVLHVASCREKAPQENNGLKLILTPSLQGHFPQ